MSFSFQRITYAELNARQKESYNFQQLSGLLAEYGFTTIRLSDDWNGADFLAQHLSGPTLKVQLKGRLTVARGYVGKDLWVAFRADGRWFLIPHDQILNRLLESTSLGSTHSWVAEGVYSFPTIPKKLAQELQAFRLE